MTPPRYRKVRGERAEVAMLVLLSLGCAPVCDPPGADTDVVSVIPASCPAEAGLADGQRTAWTADGERMTSEIVATGEFSWESRFERVAAGATRRWTRTSRCDADGWWLDAETWVEDRGDLVVTTEWRFDAPRLLLPATLTAGAGWAWPAESSKHLSNSDGYDSGWMDQRGEIERFVVLGDEVIALNEAPVSAVRVLRYAPVVSAYGYVETTDDYYVPDQGLAMGVLFGYPVTLAP